MGRRGEEMPPRRGAGDRLFRCGAESSPRRKALNDERRHGPAQREDTPRRAGPETKVARAGGHRCVRCESRRQGESCGEGTPAVERETACEALREKGDRYFLFWRELHAWARKNETRGVPERTAEARPRNGARCVCVPSHDDVRGGRETRVFSSVTFLPS